MKRISLGKTIFTTFFILFSSLFAFHESLYAQNTDEELEIVDCPEAIKNAQTIMNLAKEGIHDNANQDTSIFKLIEFATQGIITTNYNDQTLCLIYNRLSETIRDVIETNTDFWFNYRIRIIAKYFDDLLLKLKGCKKERLNLLCYLGLTEAYYLWTGYKNGNDETIIATGISDETPPLSSLYQIVAHIRLMFTIKKDDAAFILFLYGIEDSQDLVLTFFDSNLKPIKSMRRNEFRFLLDEKNYLCLGCPIGAIMPYFSTCNTIEIKYKTKYGNIEETTFFSPTYFWGNKETCPTIKKLLSTK